jgi:hypothetical protein
MAPPYNVDTPCQVTHRSTGDRNRAVNDLGARSENKRFESGDVAFLTQTFGGLRSNVGWGQKADIIYGAHGYTLSCPSVSPDKGRRWLPVS